MSLKITLKLFTFKSCFKKLFKYSTSALGVEMVRYFPNKLNDYTPGTAVSITKDELGPQIEEHIKNILKKLPPLPQHVDGGIYVGIAGVAYMFYYLSKNEEFAETKAAYRAKALEYINVVLDNPAEDCSFLLGDAGSYALACVIKQSVGDQGYIELLNQYRNLYSYYLNPHFLRSGADEFFVGRAGYLAGALWMTGEMKTPVLSIAEMYKLCNIIVDSGREYSKKHKSPCPLMYHYYHTEYLGAAHGLSFILQMLLTVPRYIENDLSYSKDIKTTIDFLASVQSADGNWPSCLEELDQKEHKLVHWCHGAPGVVYLMAKAYRTYKDQKYLKACVQAGEVVWNKGLLLKGPGICHGIAGNGYVFLLLYRLTGDAKYLYRAKAFADFMNSDQFMSDARVPDNPETLYEGSAGTVCYLSDLLVPERAQFPFQDVFETYE